MDILRNGQRRRGAKAIWRGILTAYWVICVAVVVVGLGLIYPRKGGGEVAQAEPAPFEAAAGRASPYPSCAAAHAEGVYDIPVGSAAYTPNQDGDGDGLACEPVR